eukprot:1847754-Rhodomonas_salina.1
MALPSPQSLGVVVLPRVFPRCQLTRGHCDGGVTFGCNLRVEREGEAARAGRPRNQAEGTTVSAQFVPRTHFLVVRDRSAAPCSISAPTIAQLERVKPKKSICTHSTKSAEFVFSIVFDFAASDLALARS